MTPVVRARGASLGEVRFQYDEEQARFGRAFWLSVGMHGVAVLVIIGIAAMLPKRVYEAVLPDRLSDEIVWLAEPGPGGGGGGGGNETPEPPKKAELPGKEKITVPAAKPPEPIPEPPKEEPKPEEPINIPAQTTAAAETQVAGIIDNKAPAATTSKGIGTGGGAGTGSGTGIGQGTGSGLGAGTGGGTGGGAYQPGNGVSLPQVVREVKPQYTAEAMRAKVQGTVLLRCVVMPDGSVGNVEIAKSLDQNFGLDQEAIKAAKQWRFRPGMRLGEPVPVLITIELTFTLR